MTVGSVHSDTVTTANAPARPWSHDIPEGPWDYIVIGSGMGGMTAAAMLSKLGRRVLVLEQHNIPGGFTQTFRRPGYRWDVGVHIVGEMTERAYTGRLLAWLTDGRLQWESVGEIYDEFHFPDGFVIQFPSSIEGFRETLADAFPEERPAIDEYIALVRQAARATSAFMRVRTMPRMLARGAARQAEEAAMPHLAATTSEVLTRLTDNPRLRSVLAAQWAYYGSTPTRSSFAMHALMVAHFLRGAYYPVGGAASIAREMLATVAAAGGWTAVRRSVDQILMSNGIARGVRLADGTEVPARKVISAAGAVATAQMLSDPAPLADVAHLESGPAHVSLYLGFEGDIESAGAHRYCQWFYDSWDMEVAVWDVSPDRPPGRIPVLFNSFPSIKDPTHDPGPTLRHTGEAITFVRWEAFEQWQDTHWQKRGDGYEAFKQVLTQRMLDQYAEHYPDLAPMIRHAELSTPLSTNHFARSDRGSIYGLTTEPDRFIGDTLIARSPVKNLYLAGVDVLTPGVAGALGGGVLAAVAAEPLRTARALRPLIRPTR